MSNETGTEPAELDAAALAELRNRLAELRGDAPALTDQQIFNLYYPVGSQTYTDGSVTFLSILRPGKFCRQVSFLDASGTAVTGGTGSVTFLLSSVLCGFVNNFAAPVNLLATPFSARPVHATSQYKLVPTPGAPGSFDDLEITLMAWSPAGTPAPDVAIDWRCRLVSIPVIL